MTPTGPVLAIDPGTRCGWCVMKPDGEIVECGTWRLKLRDDEPYGLRFVRFDEQFSAALGAYKPAVVAYELIRRHEGVEAAHVYGGLQAALHRILVAWDLPEPVRVEVAAVKQLATGKGNANKAEMVAAAVRKYPQVRIVDDNMPDALFVAEVVRTGFKSSTAKKKRKGRAAA